MNMIEQPQQRPGLLSFGTIACAVIAGLMTVVFVLGGLFGTAVGGLGFLAAENGEAQLPFGLLAGASLLISLGGVIYHLVLLFACIRARSGSRGWTIVLIVFCTLGIANFNPFTVPIYVLTMIGAAQSIGRGGYAQHARLSATPSSEPA